MDIKLGLCEIFDNISDHSTGTFATSGILHNAPNPGLFVHGLGIVGLPLTKGDAFELSKASHQAPFGQGSKTIVDTSIRNTLELDATAIELRNRAWHTYMQTILKTVASELGVSNDSIRMELYKLLLYEEGAFFDKHRDSEKAQGMFGTLVIALPAEHSGGDVEATFRGKTKILKTAPTSPFDFSYLAWYSDVEHAVTKVTAGYRLVLTYNLIHTGLHTQPSAAANEEATQPFRDLLMTWAENVTKPGSHVRNKVAFMLDHKYTDANLRLNHLKGRDAVLANALMRALLGSECIFFLANVELVVDGSCEEHYGYGYSSRYDTNFHAIEEEYSRNLVLRLVVTPDGSEVAKGLPIEEDDIVQEDCFDRDPDDEEYEGYTGNAGASATHYYRDSCLLILPKSRLIDLLFKPAQAGNVNVDSWIRSMLREYEQSPSPTARDNIQRLCSLVLASMANGGERMQDWRIFSAPQRTGFANDTLGQVIKASCLLQDPKLFEDAAKLTKGPHTTSVLETLGTAISRADFVKWQKGLEEYFLRLKNFHQKYDSVQGLLCGAEKDRTAEETDPSGAITWANNVIDAALHSAADACKDDGPALVDLAKIRGERYFFQSILPFVKRHMANTVFVVKFLICLGDAEVNKNIKKNVALNIFRDVTFNLVPEFRLEGVHTSAKRCKSAAAGFGSYLNYTAPPQDPTADTDLSGEELYMLIRYCMHFNMPDETNQLLSKLDCEVQDIEVEAFDLLMPLLQQLPDILNAHSIPWTVPFYQSFYRSVLSQYLHRFVRPPPRAPTDWVRNTVQNCACQDCNAVNRFLCDPTQSVGRFPLAKNRRAHIHRQLDAYTTCTHQTSRVGSPHTLVVTKNQSQYQSDEAAWKLRFEKAMGNIRSISAEARQILLGEDMKQPRLESPFVKAALKGRLPLAAVQQGHQPQPQMQGGKKTEPKSSRKVEFIDLT